MNILNDLFTGWKNGVLGRLKFFLYGLLIFAISLLSAGFFMANLLSHFALFIYWLGVVLSYYCGFLILTKRYRELVPFPAIFALIHWGAALFAFWKGWGWLNLLCGIIFLMLIAVPACRVTETEDRI